MEQRAWHFTNRCRAEQKQLRSNKERKRKPKRRRKNNRRFYRVFSSKLLRSRLLRVAKSTIRRLCVLTSNLVFAKRERDANTHTIWVWLSSSSQTLISTLTPARKLARSLTQSLLAKTSSKRLKRSYMDLTGFVQTTETIVLTCIDCHLATCLSETER